MTAPSLRPADDGDLPVIAAIYAEAVLHGTATFEESPPSAAEMAQRVAAVRAHDLPWLVAEVGGVVSGYAYLSPFRTRSGYRFTVECSIYLAVDAVGRGLGGALLDALIAAAEARGLRQIIAAIGDSANSASIGLHRSRGFVDAGVYRDVGWKFGRWLDVVLMQRPLGASGADPTAQGLSLG